MLRRAHVAYVLTALAAAALLSACAGSAGTPSGAPQVQAPASRALAPAASGKGLIYVADYTNNAIHIYPLAGKNQQEIGLITNVPVVEYLNVDRWHNLYVVEFSAGEVLVFPRGATTPSLTLSVQPKGNFPNAVAISHTGEVAVGQFQTTGIEFFKKGASTPFKTIAPPGSFGSAGFCAYDAVGNLYVIGSSADHASHIGEIVGGGSGSSITDLGVNTGITNAKGIQVDRKGQIVVVGDSGTLNTYAPASNNLVASVQLDDPPSDGPNPNGGFSLVKSGKNLYVASALLNSQNLGQALEYAYPAGGKIENTIDVQIPPGGGGQTAVTGVAVDPPERP
jgi:sugar lactone lactonase YvrE